MSSLIFFYIKPKIQTGRIFTKKGCSKNLFRKGQRMETVLGVSHVSQEISRVVSSRPTLTNSNKLSISKTLKRTVLRIPLVLTTPTKMFKLGKKEN